MSGGREEGGREGYTSITISSTRFLNSSLLSEAVVVVVVGGKWWFIFALAALDKFSRMKRMSSGDWTSIFRIRFGSITASRF